MDTVLVTGGAGYIGSHTCKALAAAGFRPVTLDNLSLGRRDAVKFGPLIEADILDTTVLAEAIYHQQVVGVIHFAACTEVGESMADPLKYFGNNVRGTLSVLNAMRQTGLQPIVFSSSAAVYGTPDSVPITEYAPARPINPYGLSKRISEQMLHACALAYGMRPMLLRYFNAGGADPAGDLGEQRRVESHLIPRAMLHLLGKLPDFQVFGSDFPTPDGTAIRDYIHVSDLADAHVLALRRLLDGHSGNVVNLGAGTGASVKTVLDTIASVSGRPLQPPSGARRPGDPACLVADINHAARVLGFAPKRSDIRTIVADAWRWHLTLTASG